MALFEIISELFSLFDSVDKIKEERKYGRNSVALFLGSLIVILLLALILYFVIYYK